MSSKKTKYLNMHDWIGTDPWRRSEISENFQKLDDKALKLDDSMAAATTTAGQAKATAEGINAKAESALSNSTAAVTNANTAVQTASAADVKATAAKTTAEDALTKAQSADATAASVQNQFDQVVINGDSSIEAAQARVDTNGQTYTTLKQRLDSEFQQTTATLADKADGGVFRFTPGNTGSEDTLNTITGYKDNGVAPGIRGAHVQQGSKGNENIVGGDPATIGTTTPNVIDPAKTLAHYAEVGGYDNVNNALAGLIHAYHCYIEDLATHGAIYGGSYHKITDGDYAAIVGGTEGFIEYLAGGSYSFIGAGSKNSLFARMSTILGGLQNRLGSQAANKEYSAIISSYLSSIDGNYAVVIAGNECKATKDYSMARGKGAVANNIGESVFSTGKFKTAGDSGQSTMHLFRKTTDGVMTQLLLDDASSTITTMGINTSLMIEASIVGIRTDAEGHASFKLTAHVTRGATGAPVLQALQVTPIFRSDPLYDVDVTVTTSAYQVRAKGSTGHTINWTGKLETVWSRNI